jgi:hypothetical protein
VHGSCGDAQNVKVNDVEEEGHPAEPQRLAGGLARLVAEAVKKVASDGPIMRPLA